MQRNRLKGIVYKIKDCFILRIDTDDIKIVCETSNIY